MRTASFIPHRLLRGGQLQTLGGQLPSPVKLAPPLAERVTLADGDQLVLLLNLPRVLAPGRPAVLLMHGLGGSSESSYIQRLTAKLNAQGVAVARFNHRGCGPGGAALARQIYHAGRTEDLAAVLAYLAARWPQELAVVAFSLSGNLLLRYLGDGDLAHPGLARAMAVCPPVDLERCSLALAGRGNFHIDAYYTRRLLATAKERHQLFPEQALPPFPSRMNLRLFDELYTAPLGGFASRDSYYERSSAQHKLRHIKVPTLILAAADDPIIPPASFAGQTLSSTTTLRLEKSGGHMGFIAHRPTRFGDRRWMDEAVVDWLTE